MSDQQSISQILAALAAQRPGGTPNQGPPQPQHPGGYPGGYPGAVPPVNQPSYSLPQPDKSGSLDLSQIKPVSSGSVSIADAIAKARGIAAEKGVTYDRSQHRDPDPRFAGRGYRRSRSPSRTPPRVTRDNFRDNYNPYRDERRDDRRGGPDRGYVRDRSVSPRPGSRRQDFTPPPAMRMVGHGNESPASRRGGGGGGGGGDDNSETISIESSLVGLIIGRQGENMRRIESETGARVQFLSNNDPNVAIRQCKISGSRSSKADAKAEIFRIIEENSVGKGHGAAFDTNRAGSDGPTHLREGENATQIMVPDRTVGLIIGRGGETIRDLQERSGCHVNIVSEQKSMNGLRPVNLIGTPQAAQHAKDLIMEIVDSDTKNLANPSQQRDTGGRGQGFGQDDRRGAGGAGSGGGGGEDKINDSVMVPSAAVGMIIGKGGETIKNMQSSTGCKINVAQPSRPDIERQIGLVGSRYAIEQAKIAIMEKVDAVEQKGHGGGDRRQHNDQYDDHYSQPQQYAQQPAAQSQQYSSAGTGAAPASDPNSDPYAAYGGYDNYVAMWYAHTMAQQQQQQYGGQGPGDQSGPPGAA